MSTNVARAAAVLLIGLALTASETSAQGRRERSGGGQGQDTGRRAEPRENRGGDGGGGRVGQRADRGDRGDRGPRAAPPEGGAGVQRRPDRQRDFSASRGDVQRRADAQPRADVQPRAGVQPRFESRSRTDNRWDGRDRGDDRYRYDTRRAVPRVTPYRNRDVRGRVIVPQYRSYGYRSYPRRTYVVPYGYRPYGYGPGWNLNLYFGRPYGRHVYGGPAYGGPGYGYYALDPGFAYGSLRIVDAPRYAQVFVDGYYAGEVDDYDGIFQRLNLEPGPHRIEIVVDESIPPLEFDVQIIPGETVTLHARF